MNTKVHAQVQRKEIKGTAMQIGCNVFIEMCMPVIRESAKKMHHTQLTQLYAGFIAGVYGCMSAEFGHERAVELIETLSADFKANDPAKDPSNRTH